MNELNLLDIIPLESLLPDGPASYSYSGQAPVGALVRIPFGRKTVEGIVIGVRSLRQHKLAVKASPYTLKPIISVMATGPFITAAQLEFGRWLADYAHRSLPFMAMLLTQFQRKCLSSFAAATVLPANNKNISIKIEAKLNPTLLKLTPTLIVVPHESYCAALAEQLPKATIIDLSLPPKQRCLIMQQVAGGKKTIFIGTKQAIFLPWGKLKRVIVLDEGSPFYKDPFKPPYFNYVLLIEQFAANHGAELVIVDPFPSLRRFVSQIKLPRPTLNFETTTTGDLGAVVSHIRSSNRTIICSPQRLLAQRIRCDACRADISCKHCQAPLTVNEGEMRCQLCGRSYPLVETCPSCTEPLRVWGTGAQWLGRHLRREGIAATTVASANDVAGLTDRQHFTLVGSLALATPLLPPADLLIFTDFDRAYQAADIFIRERYLRLLHFLAQRATRVIVQTDLASTVLERIATGNIVDDLLNERHALNLPPYTRLIKLTSRLQNLQKLTERMTGVRKELERRAAVWGTRDKASDLPSRDIRGGGSAWSPRSRSGRGANRRADRRAESSTGGGSAFGGLERGDAVSRVAGHERALSLNQLPIEILGPFPRKLSKRRSRYQLELALKIDPIVNLGELLRGLRVEEVEVDAVSMD